MRIGIDARALVETEPSGVSLYATELVRVLSQLIDVEDSLHLFVSGRRVTAEQLTQLAQWSRITVRHVRWPNKIFHTAVLAGLAPTLESQLGGVDVMFAPNMHFLPLRPTTPLVLTVHDLSFRYYPHFLSTRRKLWHQAVHPGRLFQRAQHLIAVSQVTADALQQEYNVPAERITVIASGRPTLAAAEPVTDLPVHFVAAIGTLEPRKNMATLVNAFVAYQRAHPMSQLHLVLTGGSGWKSRELRETLTHHPMIHYYGYATPGQKTYILQRAAALFYPSIYEGFGFPPLEALAVNTPVVVGRAGALPAVLQNTVRYVNPYAQHDLELMLDLFDGQPRQQPSTIQTESTIFDWSETARRTLQVLRNTLY